MHMCNIRWFTRTLGVPLNARGVHCSMTPGSYRDRPITVLKEASQYYLLNIIWRHHQLCMKNWTSYSCKPWTLWILLSVRVSRERTFHGRRQYQQTWCRRAANSKATEKSERQSCTWCTLSLGTVQEPFYVVCRTLASRPSIFRLPCTCCCLHCMHSYPWSRSLPLHYDLYPLYPSLPSPPLPPPPTQNPPGWVWGKGCSLPVHAWFRFRLTPRHREMDLVGACAVATSIVPCTHLHQYKYVFCNICRYIVCIIGVRASESTYIKDGLTQVTSAFPICSKV